MKTVSDAEGWKGGKETLPWVSDYPWAFPSAVTL